eukprot:3584877-Rhodomonas_salina.1
MTAGCRHASRLRRADKDATDSEHGGLLLRLQVSAFCGATQAAAPSLSGSANPRRDGPNSGLQQQGLQFVPWASESNHV